MPTIDMSVVINRLDLDRLLEAVTPAAVLKVIGLRMWEFVDESFKTRGRGGWRPLAASTLALRQHGGDMPLQDSGDYRGSFVTETDNQTYAEVGTNKKTAAGISLGLIHEYGTRDFMIPKNGPSVKKHGLIAKTRSGTWIPFGREVHHPGIPARPALPTEKQAEDVLKPVVEGMLERARDG